MIQPDLSFRGQQQALATAAEQSAVDNGLAQTMQAARGLMNSSAEMMRSDGPMIERTGITPEVLQELRRMDADGLQARLDGLRGRIDQFGQYDPAINNQTNMGGGGGSNTASGNSVFAKLLFAKEGAGNYDTLFGHSQKSGPFAGVRVSQMPISEVIKFSDPNGAYGQWVKSELARTGQTPRIATPMGAGQIVGSTLRSAVAELGLSGDTIFDANTQNMIIDHLAKKRVMASNTMEGRRAGLRAEWEGFKNVDDATLDAAIMEILGMNP